MKFLDVFAGIGGFRLGLERAGHECVGQKRKKTCYANKVSKRLEKLKEIE